VVRFAGLDVEGEGKGASLTTPSRTVGWKLVWFEPAAVRG
jgi:hypothetical protein